VAHRFRPGELGRLGIGDENTVQLSKNATGPTRHHVELAFCSPCTQKASKKPRNSIACRRLRRMVSASMVAREVSADRRLRFRNPKRRSAADCETASD